MRMTAYADVENIQVNVTMPNGTIMTLNETINSDSNSTYLYLRNYTYTPQIPGRHIFTAQGSYNENKTSRRGFAIHAGRPKRMRLLAPNFDNITIKDPVINEVIAKNGSLEINITTGEYDIIATGGRHSINLFNASLNNSNNTLISFTELDDDVEMENYNVIDRYRLTPGINLSAANVTYNFTGLNESITFTNNLKIFKCETGDNCTWEEVDVVIDSNNSQITGLITNFSDFIIVEETAPGEESAGETTTIVTQGSSTMSIADRYIDKKISMRIVPTSALTLYKDDYINAIITILNDGDSDLENITLTLEPADELNTLPTLRTIDELKVNESVTLSAQVQSAKTTGLFEIKIFGEAENPSHIEEATMTIHVIPSDNETLNNTVIVERVKFAFDLFKENPECLEFQELVTQANEAMDAKEHEKAAALLESAITACKETVTSLNAGDLEVPGLAPKRKTYTQYVLYIIIASLILWLVMEIGYSRKGIKKKVKSETTKKKKKKLVTKKSNKKKKVSKKKTKDVWSR